MVKGCDAPNLGKYYFYEKERRFYKDESTFIKHFNANDKLNNNLELAAILGDTF